MSFFSNFVLNLITCALFPHPGNYITSCSKSHMGLDGKSSKVFLSLPSLHSRTDALSFSSLLSRVLPVSFCTNQLSSLTSSPVLTKLLNALVKLVTKNKHGRQQGKKRVANHLTKFLLVFILEISLHISVLPYSFIDRLLKGRISVFCIHQSA